MAPCTTGTFQLDSVEPLEEKRELKIADNDDDAPVFYSCVRAKSSCIETQTECLKEACWLTRVLWCF